LKTAYSLRDLERRGRRRRAGARSRGRSALGAARVALGDTWLWDGDVWTQTWDGSAWASRAVNPPPPAVDTFAIAPLNDHLVLFGGYQLQSAQVSAETWDWDAAGWGLVQTPTSPPARRDHAMAALGSRAPRYVTSRRPNWRCPIPQRASSR
jgi:hypothetical protein